MQTPDANDWKALGLALLVILGIPVLVLSVDENGNREPSSTAPPSRAKAEAQTSDVTHEIWYVHSNVNVRAGPGTEHEVVRELDVGDKVFASTADGLGWKPVMADRHSRDTVGWADVLDLHGKPPPDLQLLSYDSEAGEYNRYITGRVRNNSSRSYSYVQVEISLMDGAGNVVGSTMDNVNNLGPGQVWEFRAMITSDRTEQYRIVDVSGY